MTVKDAVSDANLAPASFSQVFRSHLTRIMLHALYLIAFAVLSVLAIGNLIRNIMMLGSDARRDPRRSGFGNGSSERSVPHPEMLDDNGRVLDEPLLVMKSISLEDAREQLDAMYEGNPSENISEEDA